MSFIKLGEAIEISAIESAEKCTPMVDIDVLARFQKFASDLKKIAPKADDFLYFSAVMITAAEASGLDEQGNPKLTRDGKPVVVGWDTSGGTWKWTSNDPSIRPYANSNRDAFPEVEIIKAHKKWVGKPLCIDHKSSSVDHVRGFIVDTYYDRKMKRVIGLCALDKVSYPDLARKVETGYSNCVSMGTGVGKAVCYDCGKVARSEHEFCGHMKTKSSHCEINVDLNPIELSIVVNGADPKATIKQVLAAANHLNAYVESKEKELEKIAEVNNYKATLEVFQDEGSGKLDNQRKTIEINNSDLDDFKKDLEEAVQKLSEIQNSVDFGEKNANEENNLASDQADQQNSSSPAFSPPQERYAEDLETLKTITRNIEERLNQMNETLKTANQPNQHEETMSGNMNKKGYFQGTEEPTPGQPKYTKDPLNEDLREHDDRQMVGQKPFPGVGSVDGLHPSPSSAGGGDELERKKMLARAESEDRALRREALVRAAKESLESKAYWQGGGGVNEPTPGKVKYPADKLNEQLREKEDKQMVGQKPFPGVGPVDGLHPSPSSADVADEKKRKEMMNRASYKARFVKAANDDDSLNLGKSAWEVFYGDKLLLTASVDALSGNRSDVLGDSIATKDFGLKLIEKIKVHGADKFASMIKSAQEMPPVGAPVDAAPVPAPEGVDAGGEGDPKDNVVSLAEQVRDLSSDLAESVRTLSGEKSEMGEMAPEGQKAASLHKARIELNASLTDAMTEVLTSLTESEKELVQIASLDPSVIEGNKDLVEAVREEAVSEAKTSIAEGTKLLAHFVKYARGTQALLKQAEIENELETLAAETSEGDDMDAKDKDDDKDENKADDLSSLVNDSSSADDEEKDENDAADGSDENDLDDATKKKLMDELDKAEKDALEKQKAPATPAAPPVQKAEDGLSSEASFDTKEGRAAMRMKLAAETLSYSPVLHDAHPKGGFTTQLDTKPTGDLAKVEDLAEVQDAMLDLAKASPKVRKEAEAIHRLVSEGKLQVSELADLVAQGLDSAAVSYYKAYYGEVEGGSEFAAELVKEHAKAEMETALTTFKVKMARSYELAYDMAERGIIHNDRVSVSNQVDELMKLDDQGFETVKQVVARQIPSFQKKASRMPQVGILDETSVREVSLQDELTAALMSGNKRRAF